jgi:Ca2+-binding EF-hand superfamily protein
MSIGGISSIGGGYESISEMRQAMFKQWDTDGDGVVSSTECQTAADTMSKETGLSITADQMMSIFDLDQDGSITQAEQTEASPTWEQHMANLMDTSGTSPMGPPPPPPPSSSSDLSSELSDLADQIFTAMDTNGDGTISKTEYEAAMEQLGGQSDSTTASSTATDSSTSTTSTDTSTETTTSTEGNSLASLLAQFLDLLAMMEKDQYSQYGQNSQNSLGTDSYA